LIQEEDCTLPVGRGIGTFVCRYDVYTKLDAEEAKKVFSSSYNREQYYNYREGRSYINPGKLMAQDVHNNIFGIISKMSYKI